MQAMRRTHKGTMTLFLATRSSSLFVHYLHGVGSRITRCQHNLHQHDLLHSGAMPALLGQHQRHRCSARDRCFSLVNSLHVAQYVSRSKFQYFPSTTALSAQGSAPHGGSENGSKKRSHVSNSEKWRGDDNDASVRPQTSETMRTRKVAQTRRSTGSATSPIIAWGAPTAMQPSGLAPRKPSLGGSRGAINERGGESCQCHICVTKYLANRWRWWLMDIQIDYIYSYCACFLAVL